MTTEVMNREVIPMEKIQSYLDSMSLTANLTKAESRQFIEIAMAYGLNPFKREIYATKYGNNFSIIVGFETYLKRAERSGLLSGWKVETTGTINKQNVADSDITATITIHRKDWNEPFVHSVYFAEYVQRRADGQPNKFWKEKPLTMIKKVAMAQGFRLCFSDENGGLPYTSEEIGTDQMMEVQVAYSNTKSIPVEPVAQIEAAKPAESFEAKAGRGRPKKAVVSIDMDKVKAKVTTATDLETLRQVWTSFPELHTNKDFKDWVNAKKKSMEEPTLVEQIEAADNVDAVMALVQDVTDKKILDIAKEKIDSINTKIEADELF